MRIAVIGAGAMGSVYGGRLALAGFEVGLCDVNADHIAAIRTHGLRLGGLPGEHVIRLPATTDAADLAPRDLAIIFTDANATSAAAESAAALLAPEGCALTLQNGIGNVEALAARLGADRVVAGVTMNSAFMPGAGEARHTNAGGTWIGEVAPRDGSRVARICDMLRRAGFEAHIVADPLAQIWNKFVLNCAINPLSAITGMRAGEIYRNPATRRLLDRVIDEALAVVAAKGIRLPDPDIRRTILEHCRLRYNKPSMLQHIEQGRRTEIEAINAALVREAAALGVPVPVNETLAQIVKGLEQSRRRSVFGPPLDEAALEAAAAREPGPHPSSL